MACTSSTVTVLLMLLCVVVTAQRKSLTMRSKTWWAKYITDDLYTAGRLTETQIKYAKEAGFKSLVSLQTLRSNSTFGGVYLPDADEEREMAAFANLQFATVLNPGETWESVTAVRKFAAVYERLPKPMMLHSNRAFSASFVVLAHLMNTTDLTIDDVYRQMAVLGYDITKLAGARSVLNELSPEAASRDLPRPQYGLDNWHAYYWLMKPLFRNVFIAGQVETHHLGPIARTSIRNIINNRKGVSTDGQPSQEEVSLLNIKANTGTYTGSGRQSVEQLEKNRLDASLPTTYISNDSTVNYQTWNPSQFGDHIGYNETLESLDYDQYSLTYIRMPIGGDLGYTRNMYETYKNELMELIIQGPVLIHCRSAYRSAMLGLLAVGDLNGFDSEWALETAAEQGYFFEAKRDNNVIQLFRSVLDENDNLRSARDSASNTRMTSLITLAITAISSLLV